MINNNYKSGKIYNIAKNRTREKAFFSKTNEGVL